MLQLFRFLFRCFITLSISFSSVFSPAVIAPPTDGLDLGVLEYPKEAVKTLEVWDITVEELKSRADSDKELYESAQGYEDVNGIVVSPYYTAKIGEKDIPVYAATVFLGETQYGELHSFSEVYLEEGEEFSFNIELTSKDFRIRDAICLPEKLGVKAKCSGGVMAASIDGFGIYTFLFNSASQECAYTLFVREKIDEEAEIKAYQQQYGEDNVLVVESGLLEIPYACFYQMNNTVVYLKQGAYVLAQHVYDIMSEEDEMRHADPDAFYLNAFGLSRHPFVNFYKCDNIKFVGRGVLDLSHLDRRERRGLVFTECSNIEVRGMKIVNSPEWSFISYRCQNLNIKDVDIFGYRQNSDAFAICNTQGGLIERCFARSGDDLFDVKALGAAEPSASENITFTDCVAWGGKARCYGIHGEVNRAIRNITFKDSAVICRDATWNNERIASLAVIVELAEGSIDGVTFDNIEIFRDDGRAMACVIFTEEIGDMDTVPIYNFTADNVVFKNITYNAAMKPKFSAANETNTVNVTVENVKFQGFNSAKHSRLMFEQDEFANVTYR
ncbi:MAG: hypothetical protein IKK49_09895 [Clostridia bacterium]|nr:hypothetical protein [Clostridia bacterium]